MNAQAREPASGDDRAGARAWLALALFVLVAFVPAVLGAVFRPGAWYVALAKPEWTPPAGVFGPVWTALYLSIGVSAWLAWRAAGRKRLPFPYAWFFLQLALNAAWTPVFFGAHRPLAAFAIIGALCVAVTMLALRYRALSRTAMLLTLPYLAWIVFAAALNWEIHARNPQTWLAPSGRAIAAAMPCRSEVRLTEPRRTVLNRSPVCGNRTELRMAHADAAGTARASGSPE